MEPTRTHPLDPARSTQGVALIIVLLMLAVMSGLATGLVVNSQIEIGMATNERFYAGARAAAEAGMNRATEAVKANKDTNLLAGPDGAVDAANPLAAVNADNGSVAFLLTGAAPYPLGTTGQYSYTIRILDDDDSALYPNLTAAQIAAMLASMGEDGSAYTNINDRLILQATGLGPSGTTATVSRILEHVDKDLVKETSTGTYNPALLVYGNLEITGWFGIDSDADNAPGDMHVNGDLVVKAADDAKPDVSGKVTASGQLTVTNPGWDAGGTLAPLAPAATPFTIDAEEYRGQATHILTAAGQIVPIGSANHCANDCGWTFQGGTWTHNAPGNSRKGEGGVYFVEGNAHIIGGGAPGQDPISRKSNALPISVVALGSIELSGNPFLEHAAPDVMLVTNGDLKVATDFRYEGDNTTTGQILVRGQISTSGKFHPHGQIIVTNEPGADLVQTNAIGGEVWITREGKLTVEGVKKSEKIGVEYLNNVTGWMESR